MQAAATTVISIDYEDRNFGGASLLWTSDVGGCEAFTFSAASMPAFNDVVSSSRAFANCNNNLLYEHSNFGGASVNCFSACAYVGDAMNDRTSSRTWAASSSRCGEASCTPVTAAYVSHFTGLGCTGEEYYYTPYFGYDGVRRSWDGQGLAGTTLRTVTNRSARTADGVCQDYWPNGNTLSDFVRIYR